MCEKGRLQKKKVERENSYPTQSATDVRIQTVCRKGVRLKGESFFKLSGEKDIRQGGGGKSQLSQQFDPAKTTAGVHNKSSKGEGGLHNPKREVTHARWTGGKSPR